MATAFSDSDSVYLGDADECNYNGTASTDGAHEWHNSTLGAADWVTLSNVQTYTAVDAVDREMILTKSGLATTTSAQNAIAKLTSRLQVTFDDGYVGGQASRSGYERKQVIMQVIMQVESGRVGTCQETGGGGPWELAYKESRECATRETRWKVGGGARVRKVPTVPRFATAMQWHGFAG